MIAGSTPPTPWRSASAAGRFSISRRRATSPWRARTAVIFFNGEIFNCVELRRPQARGHVFRSTGDTEVLLAAASSRPSLPRSWL
ncbi:MAG: hypothetical protein ACYS6Z_01205 [Planctomycetota bacterium]